MKHFLSLVVVAVVGLCVLFINFPFDDIFNLNSTENNQNAEDKINRIIISEDELIYKNEIMRYKITFPDNWKGKYIITEYQSGDVCVGFYGKSKTGQIAYKHSLGRDGLDIGWVVKKIPEEGSQLLGSLGKINGIEFFLTTARGGTYLPELEAMLNSNSESRQLVEYDVNEEELNLIKQDLEVARQIWDDFYNVNFKFESL